MIICWFNGPSQKHLAETLPRQNIEIGCNYIERIRPMDAVAAFDIDVVKRLEITDNVKYYTRSDAYSRPPWKVIINHTVSGGNSGLLACWVAANEYPAQPIYIIGCDWGITDASTFNHIYGHRSSRKYTIHSKKKMTFLFQKREAYVVHNQQPDVPLPVISEQQFLDKLQ